MKALQLTLILLVAALDGRRAVAQPYGDQAPPVAPDPSAQYREPPPEGDDYEDFAASDAEPYVEDAPTDVDEATFRSSLAPYGAWVTVSGLGTVWRPYPTLVGADFQPYSTGGHWVYTTAGWTWVSDWDWGWAPFHYGRWWLDDYYGWVWVPGYAWAPAWVSWRWGGGYIGWAPLAPYGFRYQRAYWGRTWCFVDDGHFTSTRVFWHREPAARVEVVRARTSSGGVRGGPPVANVARVVGSPIRAVPVRESGALPVQNVLRPKPPGGGAGMIRTPQYQQNVTRPQTMQPRPETVVPSQRVARPTYSSPMPSPRAMERPPSVVNPPPRAMERPTVAAPSTRPVERPNMVAPSARPMVRPAMSAPSQPQQVRPSSMARPPAGPQVAPVARPAPAGGARKK